MKQVAMMLRGWLWDHHRMGQRAGLALLILLPLWAACSSGPSQSATSSQPARTKLTIGLQLSPAMALVMAAKDLGAFDEQGLDVELRGFTAGKFALQAFLGGSLDYAVSGEVPVTLSALQGNTFALLAQVVERTNTEVRVVARREGTLGDPKRYFSAKKRKLATSFGGGPEFYTYNFLNKIGISKDQVEIVSQSPENMPAALVSGSVDAVSIFDPFAFIAEKQMGAKGITFADPSLYSELYVLVGKEALRNQDPDVSVRVLKALVKAQELIRTRPADAKRAVAGYTKLDQEILDGIWENFVFAPALTQRLLQYQQDEARWALEQGTVPASSRMPDFKQYLWDVPLRAASPDAIRLE
jgi:NitT/TauT family transport system substrate-binding protein